MIFDLCIRHFEVKVYLRYVEGMLNEYYDNLYNKGTVAAEGVTRWAEETLILGL